MGDISLLSDTNIYKNTYAELVLWIKELIRMRRDDAMVYDRNIWQAGRIMELEFDLRKYRHIMVQDKQETVVKEMEADNVISNEDLEYHRKRRGGGGLPPKNYLIGMAWGTQFFAKPKGSGVWVLAKFMLAGVKKNVYLLIPMKGDENSVADDREWFPVESDAFCNYWELVADFPPPEDIESNDDYPHGEQD